MIGMPRACNDRVERSPLLIQHPELLPPHHRAVIDMVPQTRPVILALAHFQRRQPLRHCLIGVAAPRGVVCVLVDELLVEARGRDPVVQQDVVLATGGARGGDRRAAGEEVRGGGYVVSVRFRVGRWRGQGGR